MYIFNTVKVTLATVSMFIYSHERFVEIFDYPVGPNPFTSKIDNLE